MTASYDYIIVGAGSSGCVLAERLSRNPGTSVLLLEAGCRDLSPMIHIPLGATALQGSKVDWCYETEPEPELNCRRIAWPRGKVLGGSSCLNGMIYIRGQREDYDAWAAAGNTGWSYGELLPYFRRHENNSRGSDDYHGVNGPLWVGEVADHLAITGQFVKAGEETGLPFNPDFNGECQEGIGYYQVTIRNGIRQSSAVSHLKLARKRANLTIQTHALASRILLEGGRAIGVAYEQRGERREALCTGEVVLSAGAINSPQLLELSGIGDTDLLQQRGIGVRHHLPGVGENLQDHLTINVCYNLSNQESYYEEMKPWRFTRHIARYLFRRRGLLSFPSAQVGAFFKTSSTLKRPDAQIHFAPAAARYNDKGVMVPEPGFTATVCYLRPTSRGSVHVRSPRPDDPPEIRANYLATAGDREASIAAVKTTREIFRASCLQSYGGHEMIPGNAVETDDDILAFIRNSAVSVYHPVGTCKMGNDPLAVVDARLKVRGVLGLRVADASILPTIISGNTHAVCVVIADKCADMVLEDLAAQESKSA
mgnify:CR=1 FL=1